MDQHLKYVGIDVAKERVDVAVRPDGRTWSVEYDEAGIYSLYSFSTCGTKDGRHC